MTTRYEITRDELARLLDAEGQPRYRAAQVWKGLYDERRPLEALTNVPAALRTTLAARLPLALEEVVRREADNGTTVKWLWRTGDGAQVETVLMRYRSRATVCVSSQAGCAMGCTFCATGQAGFERHLAAHEIAEQVVRAQHASPQRVGNVVFMGMGEPLANTDAVLDACRRLHADLGLSARHLTISTVGVVPGMQQLADFELPVTLAVSLHAPDDALRERLVPLNRRYPIADVIDAARAYAARKGRRVTFEYACIDGVNDHPHLAEALAGKLVGFRGGAHVNLIPLNPTDAFGGRASSRARIEAFAERLRAAGVNATIRANRGTDIDAACGQLRAREQPAARAAPESARMEP
ncbi:MAG TPA: 23S rRNA (adenine(2503)-C(2))-methyltransferase RlmN [Acidimicrobiia bacterium]|nr:23S rRNA (adenine(2503)-C(2))-methyltransferase RlmN [Acidimicrobiia bacterium]